MLLIHNMTKAKLIVTYNGVSVYFSASKMDYAANEAFRNVQTRIKNFPHGLHTNVYVMAVNNYKKAAMYGSVTINQTYPGNPVPIEFEDGTLLFVQYDL